MHMENIVYVFHVHTTWQTFIGPIGLQIYSGLVPAPIHNIVSVVSIRGKHFFSWTGPRTICTHVLHLWTMRLRLGPYAF